MKNGHKRAFPLSEECWFSLPRAMRPSEWYKDIFHGNKLLQYNRVFMARDILKLSANFIFFDMHHEHIDRILDEYLRVTDAEPIKDQIVPPAVVPHQFKTKNHLLLLHLSLMCNWQMLVLNLISIQRQGGFLGSQKITAT